jgi:DnaK suppressor protein
MSTLNTEQRQRLEAALRQRQAQLDQQIAEHQGAGRVEMAAEWVAEDAHDARERDADREVALARADRELAELGRVSTALGRLAEPDFGTCAGCGEAIRFERLLAEPWATRCVACASAAEGHQVHHRL